MRTRSTWVWVATPVVVLLTHYAVVVPHEYLHSLLGWAVGIDDHPGGVDWGGPSVLNVLLLSEIDENVDYSTAFATGRDWQAALTAFSGSGIANLALLVLGRAALTRLDLRARPLLALVLLWFVLMNLGNIYDYVPMRVFAGHGDVQNVVRGTGISPWVVFVLGSYAVLWVVVDFYRTVLPVGLRQCGFGTATPRAVTLVLTTAVLFGYFANPSLLAGSDARLKILAVLSVMAVLPVVVLQWRRVVTPAPDRPGGRDAGGRVPPEPVDAAA